MHNYIDGNSRFDWTRKRGAVQPTETGLKIQAELDKSPYGIGIKVSDEQLAAVRMKKDDFHGEWNYTISPKKGRK